VPLLRFGRPGLAAARRQEFSVRLQKVKVRNSKSILLEIHFGNYLFCPCQKVELAKKMKFRNSKSILLEIHFGNYLFCPCQKVELAKK
jgi:hypothetical protein